MTFGRLHLFRWHSDSKQWGVNSNHHWYWWVDMGPVTVAWHR